MAELDAVLDDAAADDAVLDGYRLQNLDLATREQRLLAVNPHGAVVLGGRLTPALRTHFVSGGAIVFPAVHPCPVDVYRTHLYSPTELYTGLERGYQATPDSRAYEWSLDQHLHSDAFATLLRAMHDDAITDALDEAIDGRRCVAVMGGHALARGSSGYARAARLGRALAEAGYLVLTGGGPGAMEAVAVGAQSLGSSPDDLAAAVARLGECPTFSDVIAWVELGVDVRTALRRAAGRAETDAQHQSARSPDLVTIGVPTWFYGHEPPNPFADLHAKFFSNALREDVLLARGDAGVVYLPGAAGTVQEVFAAVTPGYYSETGGVPLVFVGEEHWCDRLPVWPLVQALAAGRPLADRVRLVAEDDPAAVLAALAAQP